MAASAFFPGMALARQGAADGGGTRFRAVLTAEMLTRFDPAFAIDMRAFAEVGIACLRLSHLSFSSTAKSMQIAARRDNEREAVTCFDTHFFTFVNVPGLARQASIP